ncbi:MAG: DUF4440 domain-containing protein [Myxococcales bacterium FL481]|nr:MAG: DUF4440 domain-containing protein [Myxococcales bacterium FL481]
MLRLRSLAVSTVLVACTTTRSPAVPASRLPATHPATAPAATDVPDASQPVRTRASELAAAPACRSPTSNLETAPGATDASVAGQPVRPEASELARALHAEIERQAEAMEIAFRRGEMRRVASFYAEDAVMLAPGGGRHAGRAAIDAYWAKFTEPVEWRLDTIGIEGQESLAVHRGRSTLVYRREGVEHTSVVEFVLVWVRVAGRWRIAVDAYWR